MANKVLLKKSSVGARAPVAGDLDYGELALNYADGKLYYKTSGNAIDTFPSLSATATLTNKTLTSPALTTPSVTGLASFTTTTAANAVNVTYTPTATTGSALFLTGTNTRGGTGYLDFLSVTNSAGGATNPNKTIRLDSAGTLQIINSAYTNNIFNLTEAGQLTVPTINNASLTGTLTAGGGVGTSGQILQSTGTGVQWVTSSAGSSGTVTSITAGTGLSGGTITTSGTIAIDATVTTLTGTQTLTNKTLTSPTINSGAISGTFTGAPTFSDTTASTTSTTGAVKIGGGLGVVGNIYVGSASKVGFVNASNVSAVYQFYNAATNSLDTVFG